jgi:hypothetical protein
MHDNPTPIPPSNPIPGDVTLDPIRIAFTNPAPSNSTAIPSMHPNTTPIHSVYASAIPIDSAPTAPTSINPNADDMAVNPVHVALAPTVPINPATVTSVDAETIPIKPSPITADGCNPAAYMPINHTHVTFAHPMPAVSVPTDPNNAIPVDPMLTDPIPINLAPIDHVHVNPVAATPADLSLIITAISHISFTLFACFGHQLIH